MPACLRRRRRFQLGLQLVLRPANSRPEAEEAVSILNNSKRRRIFSIKCRMKVRVVHPPYRLMRGKRSGFIFYSCSLLGLKTERLNIPYQGVVIFAGILLDIATTCLADAALIFNLSPFCQLEQQAMALVGGDWSITGSWR